MADACDGCFGSIVGQICQSAKKDVPIDVARGKFCEILQSAHKTDTPAGSAYIDALLGERRPDNCDRVVVLYDYEPVASRGVMHMMDETSEIRKASYTIHPEGSPSRHVHNVIKDCNRIIAGS